MRSNILEIVIKDEVVLGKIRGRGLNRKAPRQQQDELLKGE